MATIENGINGGFKGTIGNVVGYQLRGKWVVRSKPKASNKNKIGTSSQNANRAKFSSVQRFVSQVLSFIRVGFRAEAQLRNMSAHNVATSYNLQNAIDVNGILDYSKVCVSYGTLENVQSVSAKLEDQNLRINWENLPYSNPERVNDQVMVLVYTIKQQLNFQLLSGARRTAGTEILPLSTLADDDTLHCWISFISDDRTDIATSHYIGMIQQK